MTTTYEVHGFLKYTEEDIYADGCQPDTSETWGDAVHFAAPTLRELLVKLQDFVGTDDSEAMELDACEDIGRVDIQTLETEDGYPASRRDIERWKLAETRLWFVDYSFQVELVTRETVALTAA